MTQSTHILEVYEPYEYCGPNPVRAIGVSTVQDPTGARYYLLNLNPPITCEEVDIEQILVLPRYDGDSIDRATTSSCTVNICRVMPGDHVNGDGRFDFSQACHWGVGKIALAPP